MGDKLRKQDRDRRAAKRGDAWTIWNRAKWRAKRIGITFSIDIEHVVVPEFCPILGIKLVAINKRGGHDASPSLDRINPSAGYVPGNVAVISKKANTIKTTATADELLAVAKWLALQQRAS